MSLFHADMEMLVGDRIMHFFSKMLNDVSSSSNRMLSSMVSLTQHLCMFGQILPPTYLPASKTIKSIHAEYVASCTALGVRAAGVSVFRSIWTACLPHIKIMFARTDMCAKCEKHRSLISNALTEDETGKVNGISDTHRSGSN